MRRKTFLYYRLVLSLALPVHEYFPYVLLIKRTLPHGYLPGLPEDSLPRICSLAITSGFWYFLDRVSQTQSCMYRTELIFPYNRLIVLNLYKIAENLRIERQGIPPRHQAFLCMVHWQNG